MDEVLVNKILSKIDSLENNMNAKFDAVKQEMKDGMQVLTGRVDNLQEDVGGLKSEVKRIDAKVDVLQYDVKHLKRSNKKINDRLDAVLMDVDTLDEKTNKIQAMI